MGNDNEDGEAVAERMVRNRSKKRLRRIARKRLRRMARKRLRQHLKIFVAGFFLCYQFRFASVI